MEMAIEQQIEQQREEQLNQDRADNVTENIDESEQIETSSKSDPGPNLGLYIILGGLAIMADLLGFIPLLGWLLSLPFVGALNLWKVCSRQNKKSPMKKILTNIGIKSNPLSNWIPANIAFVVSSYREHKHSAQ